MPCIRKILLQRQYIKCMGVAYLIKLVMTSGIMQILPPFPIPVTVIVSMVSPDPY